MNNRKEEIYAALYIGVFCHDFHSELTFLQLISTINAIYLLTK